MIPFLGTFQHRHYVWEDESVLILLIEDIILY